ncbi:MAG: hypothetical protein JST84_05400 [Acidobacteria bacterium]|nr:hypothetical protein [Acidobacteriota bacterium]
MRIFTPTYSQNETTAQWFEITADIIIQAIELHSAYQQVKTAVPGLKAWQCEIVLTAHNTDAWIASLHAINYSEFYALSEGNTEKIPSASITDAVIFVEDNSIIFQVSDSQSQFVSTATFPISELSMLAPVFSA